MPVKHKTAHSKPKTIEPKMAEKKVDESNEADAPLEERLHARRPETVDTAKEQERNEKLIREQTELLRKQDEERRAEQKEQDKKEKE